MKHHRIKKTVSSLAIAALLTMSSLTMAADRMSERAREALANRPLDMVELIVTYHQRPGPNDRANITSNGGQIRHEFKLILGHAITVPANVASALENNPNVARISYDEPVSGAAYQYATLDDGLYRITGLSSRTAASLPSSVVAGVPGLDSIPYTGNKVKVAVLDSGFMKHGDLSPAQTFSLVGKNANDDYGHGNHVAAILGGKGSKSGGLYRGVAPDADVIAVKVLDEQGQGLTSDVIAGLDNVLALNQQFWHIKVVNMSLGHPVYEAAADDPLVQAVEAIWDSGVVVVCSAGNAGRDGYGTITSPGNSRKVITVGSITTWGDSDASNDIISTFSSRGPTLGDHFVKPDLITHGNRVISAKASRSFMETDIPENLITAPGQSKAEYYQLSGTSMAAAVVSGAAALMLEKDPSLTPDTIKARLMRSATKV
ncbi:MAG: S8 family serine peptidase, partial [Thiohalobacterales bacterium]|nr:S8 family serine peptidase [Thiohalobacterales bacterium]